MRRFSDRHALQTLSELNVTPLLDLAFVLLIIFMITTPLMENSSDLVLPKSGAPAKEVDAGAVQTIAINRAEELKLNGQPVSLEDLEARLVALRQEKPEVAVVIRSHKELPVQKLVDLMGVAKRANISKIGVVTSPEQ